MGSEMCIRDRAVTSSLSLEVVAGLGDRQAGFCGRQLDYLLWEALWSVDTGTNRGTAKRHLGNARKCAVHALDCVANLSRVTAELLTQSNRGGVHEVGAACLDHGLPELSLLLEGNS